MPYEFGEPRTFRGLTLIPLFHAEGQEFEYVGLDEAVSRGVETTEVGSEGIVGLLAVANPLDARVLLYEGEESSVRSRTASLARRSSSRRTRP